MIFNRTKIKPFKGKLVVITYEHTKTINKELKRYQKEQLGEITAATKDHVLFSIGKELEVSLTYDKIKDIIIYKRT